MPPRIDPVYALVAYIVKQVFEMTLALIILMCTVVLTEMCLDSAIAPVLLFFAKHNLP